MRPIDADALKKRIERMKKYDNQKRVYIKDVLNVIDVVSSSSCSTIKEVVLCQNCQFWYAPWCSLRGGARRSTNYCGDGRSKL